MYIPNIKKKPLMTIIRTCKKNNVHVDQMTELCKKVGAVIFTCQYSTSKDYTALIFINRYLYDTQMTYSTYPSGTVTHLKRDCQPASHVIDYDGITFRIYGCEGQ